MSQIPIGISSFRDIRKNKQLYVDKTKIIHDVIVNSGIRFHFLPRPRRFGKSLVCSTIGELFLGEKKLFKGLYIYDKWDFKKEKCPVIHLNCRILVAMGKTSL